MPCLNPRRPCRCLPCEGHLGPKMLRGRGLTGPDNLVRLSLGLCLPKDEAVRLSNWDDKLSAAQRMYAGLDAWTVGLDLRLPTISCDQFYSDLRSCTLTSARTIRLTEPQSSTRLRSPPSEASFQPRSARWWHSTCAAAGGAQWQASRVDNSWRGERR